MPATANGKRGFKRLKVSEEKEEWHESESESEEEADDPMDSDYYQPVGSEDKSYEKEEEEQTFRNFIHTSRHNREDEGSSESERDSDQEESEEAEDDALKTSVAPGRASSDPNTVTPEKQPSTDVFTLDFCDDECSDDDDDDDDIPIPPKTRSLMDAELQDTDDEESNNRRRSLRPDTVDSRAEEAESSSSDEEEGNHSISSDNNNTTSKYDQRALRYLYCCPVCYVEAYRRLDQNISASEDASDDEPDKVYSGEDLTICDFEYGPIEVLAKVDPTFELAGAFCFGRLSNLKVHIQKDHGIDTGLMVKKNDLFHRFHLSESDGLVQRHQGKTFHMKGLGYMSQYFGHVEEELKALAHARNQSRKWRKELRGWSSNSKAEEFLEKIETFWSSFSERGHRIWKDLQYAYGPANTNTSSEEDNTDEEDEGEEINHDLIFRQQLDEKEEEEEDKQFIKDLKQKYHIESDEDDEVALDDEEEEGAITDPQPEWYGSTADNPISVDELADTDSEEEKESDDWPVRQPNSVFNSGHNRGSYDGDEDSIEDEKQGSTNSDDESVHSTLPVDENEIEVDNYVQELVNHKKFIDLPEDKVDEKLKDLREANPSVIPYQLCWMKMEGGYYGSLRFLMVSTPRYHSIGVSSRGFFWKYRYYQDLDELVREFKKNPREGSSRASREPTLSRRGPAPLTSRGAVDRVVMKQEPEEEVLHLSQSSKRKRRRSTAFVEDDDE